MFQVREPIDYTEERFCPSCKFKMKYFDSRYRIILHYGRERNKKLVRKFYCAKCDRYHTELPTSITPRKHYRTVVIKEVIDGLVNEFDVVCEDGPAAITMKRWRSEFSSQDFHR